MSSNPSRCIKGLRYARAAALLLVCGVSVVRAQCPFADQLLYSSDLPVTIAGTFGYNHDYFSDDGAAVARAQITGIPRRADLDALHVEVNSDLLFSLDVGTRIGGTYFGRADLIRKSGDNYSLAFDAATAGIPARVNLDAATRRGDNLLLSFDRGFTLHGLYIRPADVVEFAGTTLVGKVLDAAALQLGDSLNVDAVHTIDVDTLLVSFDSGGRVGAAELVFADEDILRLDLATGSWDKPCAMLGFSDRWAAANLNALSAMARSDIVFKDGFE